MRKCFPFTHNWTSLERRLFFYNLFISIDFSRLLPLLEADSKSTTHTEWMFTIVDDWYLSSSFNSRKWKKEKMAKKNRKMGYSLQCCLFLEFDMFCVNDLSLELSVEQVNGKKKDTGKEEFAVWQWQTINKTCYVTTHRQSVVTFSFFFFNGGAAVGVKFPLLARKFGSISQ